MPTSITAGASPCWKEGFKGEIITTAASRELAGWSCWMRPTCRKRRPRYPQGRASRQGSNHKTAENVPLYTMLDALNSDGFFRPDCGTTGKALTLDGGIQATLSMPVISSVPPASCWNWRGDGDKRRVLFSGDLGYSGRAILRDPATPPQADVVVMETTYGDRLHKQLEPSIEELYEVIRDTYAAAVTS